ncbi:hypothetical protein [Streptomyces fructofermentans]|uniref:hypothetical protein n=1 Tax=Streptomyces fructofermentans TaxID=152141 RepID=UPI0037A017AA
MTATNDRAPGPGGDTPPQDAARDSEYSATVLGSHWFQRPEPDTVRAEEQPERDTVRAEERTVPERTLPDGPAPDPTLLAPGAPRAPETPPDRVEGTVLRFGPGVTASLAHRSHTTLPAVGAPAPARRRGLRRHALPLVVLIAVIAFLAWHRSGSAVTVEAVTVTSREASLGCEGTADIVGVITTNGRAGTVSYRWVRSDGTTSAVLREVLPSGRKQARVHLLWTFEGEGNYRARAELRIVSPAGPAGPAATRFTYDCS